jgi:hypothetical protein
MLEFMSQSLPKHAALLCKQGEFVERKREAVQAVYEVRPVPGPNNKVRPTTSEVPRHVAVDLVKPQADLNIVWVMGYCQSGCVHA